MIYKEWISSRMKKYPEGSEHPLLNPPKKLS
jgi:hypothetical protein